MKGLLICICILIVFDLPAQNDLQYVLEKKISMQGDVGTQKELKTIVHRNATHKFYVSGATIKSEGDKTLVPGTFNVFVYALMSTSTPINMTH